MDMKNLKAIIELLDSSNSTESAFEVGEKYFIRMVTHYMVGKLQDEKDGFLIFSNASWIADTGRFADFLKTGEANEVEPVKGFYRVAKTAIIDFFDFSHELPSKQK
jgi:hypothetical protein